MIILKNKELAVRKRFYLFIFVRINERPFFFGNLRLVSNAKAKKEKRKDLLKI